MPKKRKRRPVRARKDEYPGWVWMLFGLSIGLSVAFAIYMKQQDASAGVTPVNREPASMASAIEERTEPPPEEEEPAKPRFEFYNMLPKFEVVIPEVEPDVSADTGANDVLQPGVYVLQAGSFTEFADADRRRAELALQGIESTIQRVTIDDRTYHRVRIGPIDDLDRLNRVRNQLRRAQIDVLRIRLGD